MPIQTKSKKNVKYGSVFRTKDFVPLKYKQENMCKIVCKMQYFLKNVIQCIMAL